MPCNCIDRNTLKNKFKQCAKPTEQDFATLIDAFFHPCEDDTICNNLTLEGTDGFNQPGETATLFLGDEHHSIKSTNAKGVSISTYGANDAIFVEQGTGSVGIGTTTPAACGSNPRVLDVNGDMRVQGTLCADDLMVAGSGLVPVGAIIMWSGTTAPNGWALCNGNNGTPDLRGRFIVGYESGSATYGTPGLVGGVDQHNITLSKSNIPKHKHLAIGDGATINIQGSGNHDHNMAWYNDSQHDGNDSTEASLNASGESDGGPRNTGAHTHPNSSFNGTVGDGTQDGLGGQPVSFDNRPRFYVLAFIIKL